MIFDRNKLKVARNRSVDNINKSLFIRYAADDIIERLAVVNKTFENILNISAKSGYLTHLLKNKYQQAEIIAIDMSPLLIDSFEHDNKLLVDEEKLEFSDSSFDLIVYSLGLHWINDVQNFLANVKKSLKPNGIFIGNFVGGSSLKNLRKFLIETESLVGYKHSPHISPFINFDDVPILFSRSGFLQIITDYENIALEFNNPLDLMREIQNIGESNSLFQSSNYAISKQMFLKLADNNIISFKDHITLISFIATSVKNGIKLKL